MVRGSTFSLEYDYISIIALFWFFRLGLSIRYKSCTPWLTAGVLSKEGRNEFTFRGGIRDVEPRVS